MGFANSYADAMRAAAYDELEFGGTYHLAFRDLPRLVKEHVKGARALDFGCGTGRSTRLLQRLGFATVGVDISQEMVTLARKRDPDGDYRVVRDGDLAGVETGAFDLVLSAFTFDNIPDEAHKTHLFSELRRALAPGGVMVSIVSAPEIYLHEWASFSTRDYPENRDAKAGDVVNIVITANSDHRPVQDVVWPHADYLRVYAAAGLEVAALEHPLAAPGEAGIAWLSETEVAPWAIYVLRRAG